MADILEQLAEASRKRVETEMQRVSLEDMVNVARAAVLAPAAGGVRPFEAALAAPGINFICECKKASPSKGLIAPQFDPVAIACDYVAAGAAAISVLTEPTQFLGSDEYLRNVAAAVNIPVLRKDFIIDEYQIYQARTLGAAAVLLIVALLEDKTLARFIACAESLGMSALVEAHDEDEVRRAVAAGAKVVGVNNRNLRDFSVDFNNSIRLRECAPQSVQFVAESGVKTADDVALLSAHNINAVLIGETLMRAQDKRTALAELRGDCYDKD